MGTDRPGDAARASSDDRASSRGGLWRSILAALLIGVSVIAAPIAVLGSWARIQLVDTERFVRTFAPLADDPGVQALVTTQVMHGIDENLDIDGLVDDAFSGLGGLGLPSRAAGALSHLAAPAAEGVRSMIQSRVETVVDSPQFASLWEGALRQSHGRAVAVLQDEAGAAVRVDEGATLSLQIGVVNQAVKAALINQGFDFASAIPDIDGSIPIITASSLLVVQTVYTIAVRAAYWLPWVLLGLAGLGIALARNRTRSLSWTGLGLATSLATLAAGIGVSKRFFVSTVSPSVMPAETSTLLFNQLTEIISASILTLVVVSLVVAVGAWFAGESRYARAIRDAADSGFGAVRSAAGRHGLSTGGVGVFVERWHSQLVAATALIAVLAVFFNRPPAFAGVFTTLIIVLLALAAIELLRRPSSPSPVNGRGDPGRVSDSAGGDQSVQ